MQSCLVLNTTMMWLTCMPLFRTIEWNINHRTLIAMGVTEGWNVTQMDVSTAFLYDDLEEETSVEIPEGVTRVEGMVWKVLEYTYGLK